MKLMKFFAVLVLVGISNVAFGSGFYVKNYTRYPVKVNLKVEGELYTKEITLKPFEGQDVDSSKNVISQVSFEGVDGGEGHVRITSK